MNYRAPVDELRFALRVHGNLDDILQLPASDGLDADTVDAVLEEAAKFAEQEWAPTNRTGDLNGASLSDGLVQTHPDLATAYRSFCEAGWAGLRAPAEFGGQALPAAVSAACEEMWCAANLSLSLMPMLTLGAVDALLKHGSDEQKQTYLPKMCTGEWNGTMVLSEPDAGSDLGNLTTRAEPFSDGTYRLNGQKIFITWGGQEMTENTVHLVLARLPDAAAGVQGISMFVVPKFLVNSDGTLGGRNGVHVIGLEHKLGLHASPTCTMQFDNAVGYLVGRVGKGLAYMFTMMKTARLNVGIEGHAVAERAYQNALAYAKERVQGHDAENSDGSAVPIIRHADVRRMLLVQKATLAAQRALYLRTAALVDTAASHEDNVVRKQAEREADFLIPIVKAWLTDNSTVLTNLAIQTYGGAGYVEESGVAQYMRDARITPIYEGTNGIQAADLAGRKTSGKNGALPCSLLAEGKTLAEKLSAADPTLAEQLQNAVAAAEESVAELVSLADAPVLTAAASAAYLQQMGLTLGAIGLARTYVAAQDALDGKTENLFGHDFYTAQQHNARVYFAYVLPQVYTCAAQIKQGQALLDVPLVLF
ncbi:acyl-CoA dehydrogenase [Neisseria chenwenguii]|uniref:3-methylmercaptopropionyl-CoA dehydrogenase n=1 Tax=Neisseria chenwenguii TaxID=1853278 RepID=A0A220S2E1_9NEIS|nr:acyl-CoA dehydrogenase [Neisseria chenwenguii]ASK27546.1 acyl-CoA dehydrogenase [Neisseria chenwenguii]